MILLYNKKEKNASPIRNFFQFFEEKVPLDNHLQIKENSLRQSDDIVIFLLVKFFSCTLL